MIEYFHMPLWFWIILALDIIMPLIYLLYVKPRRKKRHLEEIMINRAKLFKEIPKEEIFGEDSIFIDTLDEAKKSNERKGKNLSRM